MVKTTSRKKTPRAGRLETPPESVVEVTIGGRRYPVVSRPLCRTCQSPHRLDIEHKILSGYSFTAIAAWAAEQDPHEDADLEEGRLPPPGPEALRTHARAHMAIGGAVRRALMDRRVAELAADGRDDDDVAVDPIGMARLTVQIGLEGLADGSIKPDMPDVLAAAKFLATHDVKDDGPDADAWRDAILTYMEVARTFIPPNQWGAFGVALAAHPVLRQLAASAAQARTPAIAPLQERDPQ